MLYYLIKHDSSLEEGQNRGEILLKIEQIFEIKINKPQNKRKVTADSFSNPILSSYQIVEKQKQGNDLSFFAKY